MDPFLQYMMHFRAKLKQILWLEEVGVPLWHELKVVILTSYFGKTRR